MREIRALAPRADLIYLADQANAPYGEKGSARVRQLAVAAVERLIGLDADEIVVACNTASAAALHDLRERFPGRIFVGMEPAVKPAVSATRSGAVAVLATPTTFEGEVFDRLVGRFAAGVEVVPIACPGWAAAVEESWPIGSEAAIREHLAPVLHRGIDTIVLACTHYSFIADVIQAVVGPAVLVIDPVGAVARQTRRVCAVDGGGTTRFVTTGHADRFASQVERLLGERVAVTTITG